MSFVLDNSVAMRWLFGDGGPGDVAYAEMALDALKYDNAVVPVTWRLEVANVVAKAEAKGLITEARSDAFLEMLDGVGIDMDAAASDNVFTHTLQLARRYSLSSYDASYLEVALRLGLPLATLDGDLRKAAKKAGVKRFEGRD